MSKPVRLRDPIPCPGSYCIDLYCRYANPDHGLSEFPVTIGEFQTRERTERFARKLGWILHRDDTASCPKCAKALGLRRKVIRGEEQ